MPKVRLQHDAASPQVAAVRLNAQWLAAAWLKTDFMGVRQIQFFLSPSEPESVLKSQLSDRDNEPPNMKQIPDKYQTLQTIQN